jgi:hypothetical protein
MGIGSQANMVALQLKVMLRDIHQEILNILASGRAKPPQNLENHEFFEKIKMSELRLKSWEHQLSQMEASISGQWVGRGGRIEAQRHDAYRLRQSRGDRTRHIGEVQQLATEVAGELKRLIRLCVDPTAVDLEEDFSELADDSVKVMQVLQHVLKHPKTTTETRTAVQHAHIASQAASSSDIFGTLSLLVTLSRIVWLARIKHARQHRL